MIRWLVLADNELVVVTRCLLSVYIYGLLYSKTKLFAASVDLDPTNAYMQFDLITTVQKLVKEDFKKILKDIVCLDQIARHRGL